MIYFLYGDEEKELKYMELISDIKKNNPSINEYIFDSSINEEEKFLEKIASNSMFSPMELVILKRAEKTEDFYNLIKILSKYNLSKKILIIDYLDEKKVNKKTMDLLTEIAELIEIRKEAEEKKILNYLKEKLSISDKEAREIFEICGRNIFKTKSESEKLLIRFYDETFSMEKAKKILSIDKNYKVFEIFEELLKDNKKEVLELLKNSNEYMFFLNFISKELMDFYKLILLSEEFKFEKYLNYNLYTKDIYPKIKEYFSAHPYALFIKIGKLSKFTKKSLKENLRKLLNAEASIKAGIFSDKEAIENFIISF